MDDNNIWTELPWLPIYRINKSGDLQSIARSNRWKTRKRYENKSGYQFYALGRGVLKSVHELVLTVFVGPRPLGMVCRHLDGNPSNNNLSNLKWGTQKENQADQYVHGTRVMGEKHPMSKVTDHQRSEIKRRYMAGEIQRELGNEFGLTQATVSYLVNH